MSLIYAVAFLPVLDINKDVIRICLKKKAKMLMCMNAQHKLAPYTKQLTV